LVFGRHFASLRVIAGTSLLDEGSLSVYATSKRGFEVRVGKTALLDTMDVTIGAFFGRVKSESVHQINIRLEAVTLIVRIADHSDFREA
jgi:hypothetical protein